MSTRRGGRGRRGDAGDQILGFLWAIDGGTLSEDARAHIGDAARMAAIHRMGARAIGDVSRRTRDEALRRLLDGAGDRQLLGALGLDGRRATGVLAVRPAPDPGGAHDDIAVAWLGGLVALSARVQHPDARCVTIDGTVYLVIASGSDRLPDLTELAWTIVERSAGHAGTLLVGVATAPRPEPAPVKWCDLEVPAIDRDASPTLGAHAQIGKQSRALPTSLHRRILRIRAVGKDPHRQRAVPAWCSSTAASRPTCSRSHSLQRSSGERYARAVMRRTKRGSVSRKRPRTSSSVAFTHD